MADQEKVTAEAETPVAAPAKKKGLPLGALIGIIVGALVIMLAVVFIVVVPLITSNGATSAYNVKDYTKAYEKADSFFSFFIKAEDKQKIKFAYAEKELGGKQGKYYDASKILEELRAEGFDAKKIDDVYGKTGFDLCKIGNVATLATFEQDADNSNGAEELQWVVLDIKKANGGAMALIMTKDIVGTVDKWTATSNQTKNNWSYAESEIAAWCHYDFYSTLIQDNPFIKKNALKINVSTEKISADAVECGDKVAVNSFVLSYQEAQKYAANKDLAKYFTTDECNISAKAKFDGLTTNGYWLRNAGTKNGLGCAYVKGELTDSQQTSRQLGIRPCMWISIG